MILQSICNDIGMLVEEGKALGLRYSCWTELHPEGSLAKSTELIRRRFEPAWDPSRPYKATPSVLRTLDSREPGAQASMSRDAQLPRQHSLSSGFTKSEQPRRLSISRVSFSHFEDGETETHGS